MKIGILLTAYNQKEYIDDCMEGLIAFKESNYVTISCVSVPFKEYKEISSEDDGTRDTVAHYHERGYIDYLFTHPDFISEAEARNLALQPLLDSGCDYILLVDADEIYDNKHLKDIFEFVDSCEFIAWWTIALKNFWGEGYIKEPFCPPRIFKTRLESGLKLSKFYFDNEVFYSNSEHNISFENLPKQDISKEVAWIPHYSWLNNEKTKTKIIYQEKHFSHGAGCSYKWGENGIEINEEYYRKTGEKKPTIIV